jgi:uncharacterized protein
MLKHFVKLIFVTILLNPFFAGAYVSPGAPTGHVNDFAGMLQPQEKQELEQKLTEYQQQSSHEIAVVTIPTIGTDETIETYAEKLFQEWGIGKANQDNGALLLIARDDRALRIEVGYGLEPELTDIESGRIIRDVITPAFQQGNFSAGISEGVQKMTEAISVESYVPETQSSSPNFAASITSFIFPGIFFLLWIVSIFARSKSWWVGGVVGGILGLIFRGFGFGLIGIIGLTALGLLLDFIVSRGYNSSMRNHTRPPWWTGGGGMGGFGGGRGGGGFGGFGGGRSGGGGASGRW